MAVANGSVECHLLAKRLKAAGQLGVRREMLIGLREAAKPVIPLLREAARADLPHKGGLDQFVSRKRITVSVTTGARTAGVRVRSKQPGNYTNQGTWRHPVFADPKKTRRDWKWVTQTYEPGRGWWDKTVEANRAVASARARAVLARVAQQVNGLGI